MIDENDPDDDPVDEPNYEQLEWDRAHPVTSPRDSDRAAEDYWDRLNQQWDRRSR